MFLNHQPSIEKFAKQNENNFFDVVQFVLLTIQQSLYSVPLQMREVKREGIKSSYLWGVKGQAWKWHSENKARIFDNFMLIDQVNPNPDFAASELMLYAASLPGLGLAKGGFLVQLAFGLAGCLDSHNVERYGLSRSQVSAHAFKNARTPKTRHNKVNDYLALCAELGGTKGLWDSWCTYVYNKQGHQGHYESAHHVSALHCEALGLGN